MPLPLIIGAGAKVAGSYISKHLLTLLLGAGYFASTGLGAAGKLGERRLAREEIKAKTKVGTASAEATKKLTLESQAQTKEFMKQLVKAKRDEKKEATNAALLQSFMQSQDSQMALTLQAVQAMSRPSATVGRSRGGSGMVNMLQGGY